MPPTRILLPLGDPRASELAAEASLLAEALGVDLGLVPAPGAPASRVDGVRRLSRSLVDACALEPAAAVVLSTRGRAGVSDLQLDGVADALVQSSDNPIVLVGPRVDRQWRPGRGPLVFCFDGAAGSVELEPLVLDWARALDRPVEVVTVLHRDGEFLGNEEAGPVRSAHGLVVERLVAAGIDARSTFLDGIDAGRALADHADHRQAGLLFASAHSHSGPIHRVMGSTAMRVVHTASCPIVSRRPTEGAPPTGS